MQVRAKVRRLLDHALAAEVRPALARRAQSNERLLSVDNSRGHERLAIPVFNGVDAENDHNTFTYVPHCVVNEGLRLLMGGPLREPAPCPFIAHGDAPGRPEGLPYDEHRRFVHPPHTVESVYECSLTSGCSMECENRLVQRGPTFRLEVFRCGGGVQMTEGRAPATHVSNKGDVGGSSQFRAQGPYLLGQRAQIEGKLRVGRHHQYAGRPAFANPRRAKRIVHG